MYIIAGHMIQITEINFQECGLNYARRLSWMHVIHQLAVPIGYKMAMLEHIMGHV